MTSAASKRAVYCFGQRNVAVRPNRDVQMAINKLLPSAKDNIAQSFLAAWIELMCCQE
jgi:hypothetical protein